MIDEGEFQSDYLTWLLLLLLFYFYSVLDFSEVTIEQVVLEGPDLAWGYSWKCSVNPKIPEFEHRVSTCKACAMAL